MKFQRAFSRVSRLAECAPIMNTWGSTEAGSAVPRSEASLWRAFGGWQEPRRVREEAEGTPGAVAGKLKLLGEFG